MAKKLKYYLDYNINANCLVHIDPAGRNKIMEDIGRGEVSLSLSYTTDDGVFSTSVYPDRIEGGAMTFTEISDDVLNLNINGSYFQELDPKWEQDLIDEWKLHGPLKVYSSSISDSKPTNHYINGSEEEFELGSVSLVEK